MSDLSFSIGEPLQVADLIPLRRILRSDSMVLRVDPDGTVTPHQHMPALFFERSLGRALVGPETETFAAACSAAVAEQRTMCLPVRSTGHELVLNPILDERGGECRYLVCWIRHGGASSIGPDRDRTIDWSLLSLDDVVTRYRRRSDDTSDVVEAAPWWALPGGGLLELWPHHPHVSATGLGPAVMQALITDAAEAAAGDGGGPAVRVEVPSAELLGGLVPVFHSALKTSGLDPAGLLVAVDVSLAAEPDLMPILVHLRTLGLRLDVVGLDSLTVALHSLSDTSSVRIGPAHRNDDSTGPRLRKDGSTGRWFDSLVAAA